MRLAPLLCLLAVETALFNCSCASAQITPAARIVEKVDESQLVSLRGSTLPVANPQNDRGRVRSDLQLTDLVLVLSRSPEQQAAFDSFVASQYNEFSKSFHHWLEPAQVGEQFGPAPADIAIVSHWLAGHGLKVAEVSKDRMAVRFSGTAAQVESAFHTEIHNLQVNGQAHIANMSDLQIPAALAPVVAGVKALNDFHPRPLHRLGKKVQYDSATGTWQRIEGESGLVSPPVPETLSPRPEFGITVGSGSNSYLIEDVTPYDFATMYNVLPLWNAGIDGTGQSIAIVATSDVNPADVAGYRSLFGLPAGPALKTIIANGQDPGACTPAGICSPQDQFENTLDVELSGAVAKGAQIVLVASGPTSPTTDQVYSSASYAIQNNTAKILSVSYGNCELFMGTSGNMAYDNLWETAAVEGIGVFVASGDAGSPACDQDQGINTPYLAQFGLAVSGIASTPYNTAVGGTDLNWCTESSCTAAPYWDSTNSSSTGANALNYVPEVPWNDSCTNPLSLNYFQQWAAALSKAGYQGVDSPTDAESACQFVVNWWNTIDENTNPPTDLSVFVNTVGGGGGASNCTVNSTTSSTTAPDPTSCSGGYAKPDWQTGVTEVPSDGRRDSPDVSFFAGNGVLGSATLICESEAGSCVESTTVTSNPVAQEVGGTSVSAPEMAGVMALINQKAGSSQGNPNAMLYALAARQNYSGCSAESVTTSSSCYFNDVDTGTNAMPCQPKSPGCTVSHSGDDVGVLSGFSGRSGYDQATGLGSLNVANVVNNWSSSNGTAIATLAVAPSQNTVSIDESLTVTVTVTGPGDTPTGNVALTTGSYIATPGPLKSGSYTFTIPPYSLAAGAFTLTITYSGDSTYAETSATTSVTVTKLTPSVAVTPSLSTVGANATVNVVIAVSGAGPTPTGSIELTDAGYPGANCTLTGGTCTISAYSDSLPSGADTLTAVYSGDSIYATGNGTAALTVKTLTPTVTAVPSLTNLDTATPLQLAVTVTGTGATPTGTVILNSLCEAWLGSGTLSNGTYTFAISPGYLSPGVDTLSICYTGDTTYIPANSSATVTVTKGTLPLTATPSATSISTNNSLTITGTLGANLFFLTGSAESYLPTGTITVTSGGNVVGSTYMAGNGNSYSITIPPGALSAGTNTLTVAYGGSYEFNPSSATTTVSVTQWALVAPTVSVTAPTSVDTGQSLVVAVAVAGPDGTPTGTVTLTGGGLSATDSEPISNGAVTFTIEQNFLSAGSLTLTANYSGDATYLSGSGTSTVTVTQSVFALSATNSAAVAPGGLGTSTVTVLSSTNYSGVVTLSCALTSGPSNQTGDGPTCSAPFSLTVGQSAVATVSTVAAGSAALVRSQIPGKHRGFATGAAALALLILFGIPARRRNWRKISGALVLLIALGALSSCSSGGSGGGCGSSCGGQTNPGTASGTYTFTLTGTGLPGVTPAPTATFTMTVN